MIFFKSSIQIEFFTTRLQIPIVFLFEEIRRESRQTVGLFAEQRG
jgi:hypothetical protein